MTFFPHISGREESVAWYRRGNRPTTGSEKLLGVCGGAPGYLETARAPGVYFKNRAGPRDAQILGINRSLPLQQPPRIGYQPTGLAYRDTQDFGNPTRRQLYELDNTRHSVGCQQPDSGLSYPVDLTNA